MAEAEAESVPLIDTTIERCSSGKVVDVEEVDADTRAGKVGSVVGVDLWEGGGGLGSMYLCCLAREGIQLLIVSRRP